MAEEMVKYLQSLLHSVDGLLGIVITDRDGVPLLKAATENAPELGMRPGYLSTFGMAADQAGKLGLGKNKKIVCIYGNYQVIHLNHLPLVISIFGTESANTGLLMDLESHLSPLVSQLSGVVEV
ncbi:late endosomal/lysosomal adaptor, MAPK and MTOR activator 3 [Oratosquilla oratoria]|uniref:late endosomal/lysosomal adaptor, MAPK and MTOR activator 3 n=1 Tax=Oratosquilla oratoria TaxID=337810 RepID=UPI003F76C035